MRVNFLIFLFCSFSIFTLSQSDTLSILNSKYLITFKSTSLSIERLITKNECADEISTHYEEGEIFLVEDIRKTNFNDTSFKFRDLSYREGITNILLLGSTFGTIGPFYDEKRNDTIHFYLWDMLNISKRFHEIGGPRFKPLEKVSFNYFEGIEYIIIPLYYQDPLDGYNFYHDNYVSLLSDLFGQNRRDILYIDLHNKDVRVLRAVGW